MTLVRSSRGEGVDEGPPALEGDLSWPTDMHGGSRTPRKATGDGLGGDLSWPTDMGGGSAPVSATCTEAWIPGLLGMPPAVGTRSLAGTSGLGRNVAALTGGQLATWTMTIAWTLVVPRLLGPSQMGVLVMGWSVSAVLGVVLGLGARSYLVREMVARPERGPGLVGTTVVLRLCLVPVFAMAAVLYSHLARLTPDASLVLYLATGATVFLLLAEPWQAAFQAREQMHYLAMSDVVSKSAQGLAGIVIALLGFRAAGLTACWMVTCGCVVVLDAWWLRRLMPVDFRTSVGKMRTLFRDSAPYYASGTAYMVYLWIDSAMLAVLAPARVVGWYGVPTKLFTTLMFVPVIVSTAWLPRLVSAFERGPESLRRVARTPVELVFVLALPICVGTAMLAGSAIHVLYGPLYLPSVPVMRILALTIPLMYLSIILNQVVIAADRPMAWTWIMVTAAVVNPALNLVLIRRYQASAHNGAIGAALALLLTEAVVLLLGLLTARRQVRLTHSMGRFFRTGLAAMSMWAAMYMSARIGFVVEGVVGFVVYAFLVVLLRAVPDDAVRALAQLITAKSRLRSGRPLRREPQAARP